MISARHYQQTKFHKHDLSLKGKLLCRRTHSISYIGYILNSILKIIPWDAGQATYSKYPKPFFVLTYVCHPVTKIIYHAVKWFIQHISYFSWSTRGFVSLDILEIDY